MLLSRKSKKQFAEQAENIDAVRQNLGAMMTEEHEKTRGTTVQQHEKTRMDNKAEHEKTRCDRRLHKSPPHTLPLASQRPLLCTDQHMGSGLSLCVSLLRVLFNAGEEVREGKRADLARRKKEREEQEERDRQNLQHHSQVLRNLEEAEMNLYDESQARDEDSELAG